MISATEAASDFRSPRTLVTCIATLVLALSANTVLAQFAHSDVFFTYGETQIEIEEQGGRLVIPQVFPDSGFFAQANNNPGFFSESDLGGGTGANDIVGYNVLDDLIFWSDGTFSEPKPSTEIHIFNNPTSVEETIVGSATGEQRASFSPLSNSIDQSSSGGEFHSHVDFQLEPMSDDPDEAPTFGAYGLKLSLTAQSESGIADSDPFFIVFRFGIDDDQFELAIEDFDDLLQMGDGLLGDFDADNLLTVTDIDLLSAEVRSASNSASFDINNDGEVNGLDRANWIELAGTLSGDSDLNGSVEFADFLTLSSSFGQAGGWGSGDFDGNGSVEFADFLALSRNFGGSAAASAVPEPDAVSLLAMAGLIGLYQTRSRRRNRCYR